MISAAACIAFAALALPNSQCDTATADAPCCAGTECRPRTDGCGEWTDCGAKCTVAFTQQEQRTCNDGMYARLIGHDCNACPEDATATADEANDLSAEQIGAIVGGSVGGVVLIALLYAVWTSRNARGESTLALLEN